MATQKKIARTKRTNKAKPVAEGIRRAAERSGIRPPPDARAREFIDGIARTGQTLSRPALDALARLIRQNGDDNDLAGAFEKEAERASIEIPSIILPDTDPAVQLAFLKDKIVSATDLVSEAVASVTEQDRKDTIDLVGIAANLDEIHLALWRIRWECYASAGNVATKSEAEPANERVAS